MGRNEYFYSADFFTRWLKKSKSFHVQTFDIPLQTNCHDPKSGLTTKEMLLKMAMPYEGTGRILYTDRFYTSPEAACLLLHDLNLYLTGIVSPKRRGIPPNMQGKANEISKGHTKALFCHEHQLSMIQFRGDQASKSCVDLSTFYGNGH